MFYLFVRSKGKLVGRIYGFSMYCMHYFVYCVFWYMCDDIHWYWRNWLHEHSQMSLDGNCDKSGQTNGYLVNNGYFRLELSKSPLGVVACLPQSLPGILQGHLAIYPAGLGGAHQDSGVGCSYWWLHIPINPQHVLWDCSLAIMQAALYLGDVALLKEFKDYTSTVKCGVIVW